MSANDNATQLNSKVELLIPTQCGVCREPLPDDVREAVLKEMKGRFSDAFGGFSVTRIQGGWKMPDGTLAEEPVDVLWSKATAQGIKEHAEGARLWAVEVADRLSQDCVALVINDSMAFFPRSNPKAPCAHKTAGKIELSSAAMHAAVKAAPPSRPIDRLYAIQSILSRFESLADARALFCGTLGYTYADAALPAVKWPDSIRQMLRGQPQVISDTGGFRIVYLRLSADRLIRSAERTVINRILRDDPAFHGLFVVSDGPQEQWRFINAKQEIKDSSRFLLRRITIGPGRGVRTATERLGLIDLEQQPNLAAPAIQELHDKAFDVETVTKQFFAEIANWYFWALKHTQFPEQAPKEADGRDHISVIRLITRLIFCWFIKEKGLIPEDLFDEKQLERTLVGFPPDNAAQKGSIFYRAILQNLFFATLNTEMDKRAWAKDEQNFMAHSLYRYRECFQKPNEALGLFKSIPFLNGGLFECLDKDQGEGCRPRYIRIDGFSRRDDSQPTVPDFLFFGPEVEVDLSQDYGEKRFKKAVVRGLIHTLRRYNFTIEENTPIDQDVALDPELSGKVFENLLAAYNPETDATARKQTGSFYTPRPIVDYMVDEALIAFLKSKLGAATPSPKEAEPRLRHLFAFNDEPHRFSPAEVDILIAAIDNLKALDPAVGSGAFPMGILHKLVFILGKLDPRNESWKQRQIQRVRDAIATAERIEDATIRDRTVCELEQQISSIEEAFQHNELDYGRKLYLIENCIYGIDIQPIAVQIAKMRFFISLIVDQRINDKKPNRGVRPLPNLETKFVAANTLISIDRGERQGDLLREDTGALQKLKALRQELTDVRHRHFIARTLASKAKCRVRDGLLRKQMSSLLQTVGLSAEQSRQLASWDPYDQNAWAAFFDPEWMFGLTEGFEVVMGNPPYVRIQVLNRTAPNQIEWFKQHYSAASKGNYDLYVVFVERSLQLLAPHGQLAFILPHKFFNTQYGEPLRKLLADGKHLRQVVHFGDQQIFPGATNYVCLLFLAKAGADACRWVRADDLPAWLATACGPEAALPAARFTPAEWNFAVGRNAGLFEKLLQMPVLLGRLADRISQGIRTSANEVYVLDAIAERSGMLTAFSKQLNKEVLVERKAVYRFLAGREIKAYSIQSSGKVVLIPYDLCDGKSVIIPIGVLTDRFPKATAYLKANKDLLEGRENGRMRGACWYGFIYPKNLEVMGSPKLLVPDIADRTAFAYDEKGEYAFTSGYGIIFKPNLKESPKYLLGLLNSHLLDWFWKRVSTPLRGGFYRYFTQFIEQLPICPINIGVASERAEHGALVGLVERILAAKRTSQLADTADLEQEIDARVYRLYGLTEDEIKLVEDSAVKS